MQKMLIMIVSLIILLIGLSCCVQSSVKTLHVVDKYESNGKCFLLLEIETTSEEYIGYDIGDDYEITEME